MTGRNTHERDSLHFGLLEATLVAISDVIDSYPAGTSVETVLRSLYQRLAVREGVSQPLLHRILLNAVIMPVFSLDALVSLLPLFWRDDFERTLADGFGTSTGTARAFTYDRQPGTEALVAVEDLHQESVGVVRRGSINAGDETARFAGYPLIEEGVIQFDAWMMDIPGLFGWGYLISPLKSSVANGSVYGITHDATNGYAVTVDGVMVATGLSISAVQWRRFKFLVGGSGQPVAYKQWRPHLAEPTGWQWTGTGASAPAAGDDIDPLLVISASPDLGSLYPAAIDNVEFYKTDANPWQIQRFATLDAWLALTAPVSFLLDGVLRAPRTGSFTLASAKRSTISSSHTLDAWVFAPGVAGFGIDAILRRAITASASLDAVIGTVATGDTSMPGDFVLGSSIMGS